MNLAFNEISFQPFTENEYILRDRFVLMIKTLKKVNEKYGVSHIIFPSTLAEIKVTSKKSFYEWVSSMPPKDKIIILTFSERKPFTIDLLQEQTEELDNYYFENADLNIEQTYCIGLSTAHILDIPSISLSGIKLWEQEKIIFYKENMVTKTQDEISVYNLSTEISVDNQSFYEFAERISAVELVETQLLPIQKSIHFRDDHGTDVLQAFANKIKNSPYVSAVINSLPFNPNTVRFIRKIYADGKIEIILHWKDEGYGMVLQTTGRNYRETNAIAEILKNEYDK